MFKSAAQILETDLLARLAYKGQRDEAVKRHLMVKKTALRLKFLFGSVAWDPPTCQWLHSLLLERLPSCLAKVYTDAFQVSNSFVKRYQPVVYNEFNFSAPHM